MQFNNQRKFFLSFFFECFFSLLKFPYFHPLEFWLDAHENISLHVSYLLLDIFYFFVNQSRKTHFRCTLYYTNSLSLSNMPLNPATKIFISIIIYFFPKIYGVISKWPILSFFTSLFNSLFIYLNILFENITVCFTQITLKTEICVHLILSVVFTIVSQDTCFLSVL